MISTTAAYLAVSNDLSRQQAATAAQGDVETTTDYDLADIGRVKSVSDFVDDDQLFSYAMKAFGLSDMLAKLPKGG